MGHSITSKIPSLSSSKSVVSGTPSLSISLNSSSQVSIIPSRSESAPAVVTAPSAGDV